MYAVFFIVLGALAVTVNSGQFLNIFTQTNENMRALQKQSFACVDVCVALDSPSL